MCNKSQVQVQEAKRNQRRRISLTGEGRGQGKGKFSWKRWPLSKAQSTLIKSSWKIVLI